MTENIPDAIQDNSEISPIEQEQSIAHEHFLNTDSFAAYMQQAAQHELLTAEEEASLGKQVLAAHAAREILTHTEGVEEAADVRTHDKERLEQIQTLGQSAVNTLVTSNLKLVASAAKKYKHKDEQIIDVVQDGNLGLMRAAEKFDPRKGYRFTTYATWWIRQSIERGRPYNSNRDAARFPLHVRQELQKVNKAIHELDSETMHKGNHLEVVAKKCGVPEERIKDLLMHQRRFSYANSLDRPLDDESDTTLADVVSDRTEASLESQALSGLTRERIHQELALLNDRQQTVIALRFGLIDGEPLTLEAIGQQIGLTRERVRQVQNEALKRMRKSFTSVRHDTA